MFSGIVEGLEKPNKIKKDENSMEISLPIPKGWKLKKGESINIDGICSTIFEISKKNFSVFYMKETLDKTNISNVSGDHNFNLERPLKLSSFVGGHLVSGHVDTVGTVNGIKKDGQSVVLTIKIPQKFSKYLIYKGSVAVNGVSLTVVEIKKDSFTVSLIPYTLDNTNLGSLKVKDKVNIEVDLVAKYLEKLAQ